MNLTLAELAALPVPAALLQGDDVVVRTPEWVAAGPGTVSYPLRNGRLMVGGQASLPACVPILDRLLDQLDELSRRSTGPQSLRVALLATSLGLLAGRLPRGRGSDGEVVELAAAGIAARTGLRVTIHGRGAGSLRAPAAAALALVQLAANAERHDGAAEIDLEAGDGLFTLRWSPRTGPGTTGSGWPIHAAAARPPAVTSRRRADRSRWGLGFARIAADAVGGALYAAVPGDDGRMVAVLELGLPRLALPLSVIRDGRVLKATRAWDEETGVVPPAPVSPGGRIARCVGAAELAGGGIAMVEGLCARRAPSGTWIAVPPDGIVDRARDVLDGMVHERALWEQVPVAQRVPVVALAAILGVQLGVPLPRVPGLAWNSAAPAIATAVALPFAVPQLAGIGAVDPQVALFVAAEIGERIDAVADELVLRVRADRLEHPLARALSVGGDRLLRLS